MASSSLQVFVHTLRYEAEGVISVEALDTEGNFRNFLNLETIVTSPKGESRKVLLQQTGGSKDTWVEASAEEEEALAA